MNSKYNVGDEILIRSDLVPGKSYGWDGFIKEMKPALGKTATVEKVITLSDGRYKYLLKEYPYSWTDEMLVDQEKNPSEIYSSYIEV